jgi:hypothetical protein
MYKVTNSLYYYYLIIGAARFNKTLKLYQLVMLYHNLLFK